MSSEITRRSIAKGAAWAAPVVVVSAAVPAYAASTCASRVTAGGGRAIDFGIVKTGTTYNSVGYGYKVDVHNLPDNVTVQTVTVRVMQQGRVEGTPGPGFFHPRHITSNMRTRPAQMPYTPTAGSGWTGTVANTQTAVNHTYVNGTTLSSWDMVYTWQASRDRLSTTYTDDPNTACRTFTTGSSGMFTIRWEGVMPMTSTTDTRKTSTSEFLATVTLSDGRVLTYQSGVAVYKGY